MPARKKLGPNRKTFQKYSPYAKKRGRPTTKKGLVKLIKNVSLSTVETKYYILAGQNQQLQHNGGLGPSYNRIYNLLGSSQGTGQENRVGDECIAKGLAIRIWLSNKLDRPNVMYRIIVYSGPRDQASIASPNNFFEAHTTQKMLDMVNTDKYTVIRSKIIQPFAGDYSLESGATNKEHSKLIKFYIPLNNRKVLYGNDNEDLPTENKNCISVAIIAYDAYATAETDTIASYSYLTKFYFKDP